jgi:hypothetical protein
MNEFTTIALWAFTILLGLDIGAGLFEARVNAAGWSAAITSRTPDGEAYMRFGPNAGQRWWMFVTPTLALVTIATLIAGFRTTGPVRPWILAGAGLQLLVLVSTFGWFMPNIIRLLTRYHELPPEFVAARTATWNALNWVRAAVSSAAWLAALRAMTLS